MTGGMLFHLNLDVHLHQNITVDETWIHNYTPETKLTLKDVVFL